jgi:hypothetical protein
MSTRQQKAIALLLAVLGGGWVWLATLQGPGVGGDATIYLASAQHFAEGIGLGLLNPDGSFRLIPYFPPLFPMALSVFAALQLDMPSCARWLHILLFAVTLYAVVKTTGDLVSHWMAPVFVGLLLAFSPVLVPAFSWVMSEPLSITLGTLSILLLLKSFQAPHQRRIGYLSALLAGLSTLTRYGAIVYTATACLLILYFLEDKFWRRLGNAIVYGILAVLPVGIWAVLDLTLTKTVSSRSLHDLTGIWDRILNFFSNLSTVILFWLLPDSWIEHPFYPAWINILVLIIFGAGLVFGTFLFLKQTRNKPGLYQLGIALALFSGLYVLMTLLISLLTYPPITIGTRMFSPMHLTVVWLLVLIFNQAWQTFSDKKLLAAGLLIMLMMLTIWTGWRGIRIVANTMKTGLGFQSVQWQQSDLVLFVQSLPAKRTIVTNEEMALLYLTDRRSYPLAEIYFDEPLPVFTTYGDSPDADQGQALFVNDGAYLVLFDSIYNQFEGLYAQQSTERVEKLTDGLQLIYQGADGAVYANADTVEE